MNVLKTEKSLLGEHHPYTCMTCARLGDLYHLRWVVTQETDYLSEAKKYYEEALSSKEELLRNNENLLLEIVGKLAKLMEQLGDSNRARQFLDNTFSPGDAETTPEITIN
jgi:hypothetical protein